MSYGLLEGSRCLNSLANVAVIVPAFNAAPYIDIVLHQYLALGVEPIVFVDHKTSDDTAGIARNIVRDVREIRNETTRVGEIIEAMSRAVDRKWILRIDDDEIPTAAMLAYVADVTCTDAAFDIYAFPRHECTVSTEGRLLASEAFDAYDQRQWRLYRRDAVQYCTAGHTPGFYLAGTREAAAPASFVHLDWVLHTYAERLAKVERYDRHTPGHGTTWRHLYLPEDRGGDFASTLVPLDFPELAQTCREISRRFPASCTVSPALSRPIKCADRAGAHPQGAP